MHSTGLSSGASPQYLLVRSQPCDDPECLKYSSQCTTLRSVHKGATRATSTKDNAQFHWGVTPRGQWSLFDLTSDQTCRKNLASEKPDLVTKLAAAYGKWRDGLYPVMIQHGGGKGEPDKLGKKEASANRIHGVRVSLLSLVYRHFLTQQPDELFNPLPALAGDNHHLNTGDFTPCQREGILHHEAGSGCLEDQP
jgi:hypothetical protein